MSLTELLPKILLALVTTVFSDIYKRISRWLTDRGNLSRLPFFLFQFSFL
jgi:hypothetical protein